jgi:hypothetical protein
MGLAMVSIPLPRHSSAFLEFPNDHTSCGTHACGESGMADNDLSSVSVVGISIARRCRERVSDRAESKETY